MPTIDRWRNWHPSDRKIGESAKQEPPKPPKLPFENSESTFEGFDGSISAGSPIISDLADEYGLGLWLLRCVDDTRWSTAITALHSDFARWRDEVELPAPSRTTFAELLSEAGFATIGGFAPGLSFVTDWVAVQAFEMPASGDMPTSMPASAAPAADFQRRDDPKPLAGARLLRWAPLPAPVQLSASETVINTERFIRVTLMQLAALLREKKTFLDGGWGLSALLDRLAACGCDVELIDSRKELP